MFGRCDFEFGSEFRTGQRSPSPHKRRNLIGFLSPLRSVHLAVIPHFRNRIKLLLIQFTFSIRSFLIRPNSELNQTWDLRLDEREEALARHLRHLERRRWGIPPSSAFTESAETLGGASLSLTRARIFPFCLARIFFARVDKVLVGDFVRILTLSMR